MKCTVILMFLMRYMISGFCTYISIWYGPNCTVFLLVHFCGTVCNKDLILLRTCLLKSGMSATYRHMQSLLRNVVYAGQCLPGTSARTSTTVHTQSMYYTKIVNLMFELFTDYLLNSGNKFEPRISSIASFIIWSPWAYLEMFLA